MLPYTIAHPQPTHYQNESAATHQRVLLLKRGQCPACQRLSLAHGHGITPHSEGQRQVTLQGGTLRTWASKAGVSVMGMGAVT